jgi:Nucleotidyltransferase domain
VGVVDIIAGLQTWPEVETVVQGGSRITGVADTDSDIDLYVYSRAEVPASARREFIGARSSCSEVDNRTWETGDEWKERASGEAVDVMYRSCNWIEGEMERVLVQHQSSLGYTTALWHNVLTAEVLFDRNGWYTKLQRRVRVPYPKELCDAIIRHNYPLLRDRQSSFTKQIVGAAKRKDAIAVNHRIAAFLASYFDVLFAANGKPHPGEKRLLLYARQLNHFPPNLPVQLAHLFSAASNCDDVVLTALLAEIVLELDPILSQTAL